MHELWFPGAGHSDDQDKSEVRPEEEGARYCEDEIKRMRRDAHITDLKVLQPDSENDGPTSP